MAHLGMGEIATRQLTDKQALFVRHMAETGDRAGSALAAGYRDSAPAAAAAELLRVPHVLVAIQNEVRRQLVTSAPLARRVIFEIAANELIHPKIRLDAARTLLDRAGHGAPRAAPDRSNVETPLHEMSTEELRALAARLGDEIAVRAKPISSAPVPHDTDAVDLVG